MHRTQTQRRLPAEWEPQDGVLLAWPHAGSDWAPVLDQVEPVFAAIIAAISRFERVVVVAPDPEQVRNCLAAAAANQEQISVVQVATNDTWARDFGPITVEEHGRPLLLDFGFNGWGLKFAACLDNQITGHLAASGLFAAPRQVVGLILEGGSIESDGAGTILTTAECLLNPNRNPHLGKEQIEQSLADLCGAEQVLWLHNGYLAGDDTDSHIDTLARLCPADTICYVTCTDPTDEHFPALQSMAAELAAFRTRTGKPFHLIPLPWPGAIVDDHGERLPATYANYLVINHAVLVPTYADPADAAALAAIGMAFPDREIIGIDCRPLILQHGSLHCVTMQLPKGVLA
jgi:agmatine deiminase